MHIDENIAAQKLPEGKSYGSHSHSHEHGYHSSEHDGGLFSHLGNIHLPIFFSPDYSYRCYAKGGTCQAICYYGDTTIYCNSTTVCCQHVHGKKIKHGPGAILHKINKHLTSHGDSHVFVHPPSHSEKHSSDSEFPYDGSHSSKHSHSHDSSRHKDSSHH